ncbi:MAG: hypothetical protein VX299_04760 [Pseudomonadota bacterium]|jgi:hypothetical protein|uniref:hypothetical protein n=1 Tax=Halomonas sp. 15WGF TaxID=2570357 RepID=UPI0010BE5364|nr:hypothetical protein [Halomonas sp. 15WGF]MEE3111285.1 hypothetical protein [Pseudomonadota bacterium]TKJ10235.1 hypothetical protein E8Q34_12430 [Halomonas sp. 15WGF]
MSYEAWRISFQDSEQAAKAAFEESQRLKRIFTMAIDSIVELTEAVGIRKEDQTIGGTVQALVAIEKLKAQRDNWKARALKAEWQNREMVARAANNHLEGYRELGRRTAAAEEERDALAARVNELEQDTALLLQLIAKIRAAAGDPNGKLMQPELIAHIAALNAHHIADASNMVSGRNSTACDDQFQPQPEAGE